MRWITIRQLLLRFDTQIQEAKKEIVRVKNTDYEIAVRNLLGDRDEQQDQYGIYENTNDLFAIVCDGMGGMDIGDIASKKAVETFERHLTDLQMGNPSAVFSELIDYMDYEVHRTNQQKKIHSGTTMVCIYIHESQLYWCSVGDSRLYVCRNGNLASATRDHNYQLKIDKLKKMGRIDDVTYERESRKGHQLISYIGMKGIQVKDICTSPFRLKKDDVILLCSDGLYKAVEEKTLCSIIKANMKAESCATAIEEAVEKTDTGQNDNTTYIIIKKIGN